MLSLSEILREEMIDFLKNNLYRTHIPSRTKCFGFFDGEDLIGVAGLYKTAWHTTEIRGVCIREGKRGNGYGTKLIAELLKLVDTPLVAATVVKENIASLKAFQTNGFQLVTVFLSFSTKHEVVFLIKNLTGG
ncbi:MAG: GNAT family N-acetyltransferase [Candidatus Methanofastidiosum sp.]|nr:GNAT family N-acetyltransferase [Methanofastidiosum sp.]